MAFEKKIKEVEVKAEKEIPSVITETEKTVKIKPNFTGKKFVGNTWFHFTKGEVQVVPVSIKNLLAEQNGLIAM